MTEAPHGTAPALEGKNIANPMAMILAVGALLRYVGEAGGLAGGRRPPRAPSTRRCWRRSRPGIRTPDLGGHATTSEFTDEVVARVRTKLEIWSSLTASRGRATPSYGGCTRRRRAGGRGGRRDLRAADRARARADGDAALRRARLAAAGALRLPRDRLRRARARGLEPGARPHALRVRRPRRRPRARAGRARARPRGAGRRLDGRRDDARVRPRAPGAGRAPWSRSPRPTSACRRPTSTSWRAGTRSRTGSSATASRVSCAPTASRPSRSGSAAWS